MEKQSPRGWRKIERLCCHGQKEKEVRLGGRRETERSKGKAAEKSNNMIIKEWKVSNEFGNKKVISSNGMGATSAEQ